MEDKLKALQAIEAASGVLTPEAVLEAAKNPESILHDSFTWDDTEAAHQHRLYQARKLISSVKVQIKTETRTVSTVFYVRDPNASKETQGYVSLTHLRRDEDLAREALLQEFSRVASALERARHLASALQMESEIENLLTTVRSLHERVEHRVSQ